MVRFADTGWGLWALVLFFIFVLRPALRCGLGPSRRRWSWDGRDWDDGPRGRLRRRELEGVRAELEQRDTVIESLGARIAELENRLDFAERLLADGRRVEAGEPIRTPISAADLGTRP